MNKSIKKNYIYNLIFQLFQIVIPIIVTPYISRVLLSDGVGQYSFSLSISNYFIVFATFGFSYYANREIAKHNGNIQEQSRIFWEIYILKFITTFVSIGVYVGLIFSNLLSSYNEILLILTLQILAVGFDASYILQGNENFKKTVTSNMFIRILAVVSIFVFVNDPSDVWIYALINSVMPIVANCFILLFSTNYLTKVKLSTLNVKRHFIPALKLFIPAVAMSIYGLLDKTLIGLLITNNEANSAVGHYDSAEKIAKIALTVVTALSAVMVPNNAKYFAQKNTQKVKENINTATKFTMLLGFPIMFGLMAVSANFVPWFFGDDFIAAIPMLMALSVLVLAIGLSNVYGIQYLVATDREKIMTVSVLIGAGINLVCNIILIPIIGALGAAISTIFAECLITTYQIWYLRKEFSIKQLFKNAWKYFVASLLMFGGVYGVSHFLEASIINTMVLIIMGVIIYVVVLLILRETFVINIIKKAIKRKNKIKQPTEENKTPTQENFDEVIDQVSKEQDVVEENFNEQTEENLQDGDKEIITEEFKEDKKQDILD